MNVVFDNLLGNVLKDRYRIDKFVDKGQYGQVFTIIDTKAVNDGD